MQGPVVHSKSTDISEDDIASIFMAEYAKKQISQ